MELFPFQSSSAALDSMLSLLYNFQIQLCLPPPLPFTAPSPYSSSASLSSSLYLPFPSLRSLLSLPLSLLFLSPSPSPPSTPSPFPSPFLLLPLPLPPLMCRSAQEDDLPTAVQVSSCYLSPGLEHLDLSGCHLVTDMGLRWVVSFVCVCVLVYKLQATSMFLSWNV